MLKSEKKKARSCWRVVSVLTDGTLAKGHYFEPTLFTDVKWDSRLAQEEIFGPVVSLIEVGNLDEAIEVNNSVIYGLSSSIFSKDVNKVFRAQRDLDTGIVYVNAGTTGAEIHLPFGGTKERAMGIGILVLQRLTSLPNGRAFMLISAVNCNGRKSTRNNRGIKLIVKAE